MDLRYSFYESTLQYNWDMEEVDRSLDLNIINDYINNIESNNDKSFIKDLLDKTMYINFKLFKYSLNQALGNFINTIENKEFYIISEFGLKKFGSEMWLIALLWSQLRNLKLFKGFLSFSYIKPLPEGEYNLLFIDDAIYSGGKVVNIIENLIASLPRGWNAIPYRYHFNYHVIAPYVSTRGLIDINLHIYEWNGGVVDIDAINRILEQNLTYQRGQLISFNLYKVLDMLPLNELIDIKKYYGDDKSYFLRHWDFDFQELPLFYFDHKIANRHSTYPQIYKDGYIPPNTKYPAGALYGKLVKELPSREKIEQLEQLFISSDEFLLQYPYFYSDGEIQMFQTLLNLPIDQLTKTQLELLTTNSSIDRYQYWLSLPLKDRLNLKTKAKIIEKRYTRMFN